MEKPLFILAETVDGLMTAIENGMDTPSIAVINDIAALFVGDFMYGFVPEGGSDGQVLTRNGFMAEWADAIPKDGHKGQVLGCKENGVVQWQNPSTVIPGLYEMAYETLAYGVRWTKGQMDPHITRVGNMSLHKLLPIQSQIRGCIAQADKVIYWLNESDWRFKKDADIVSINLTVSGSDYTIVNSLFSDLRYEGAYLKIDGVVCKIASIDVDTNTATLETTEELINLGLTSGVKEVEFGSVLNGYDGMVRIYCPGFYIRSVIDGDTYTVWISPYRIDNATYQEEILVDAYRSTILNTVPTNMGYLSTLPVNSAISVVNTHDYCRGGGNRPEYDVYLETDPCRSDLGKPRTNIFRHDMRTYSRNAGSEMLNYDQYKNIFYWLYVIEYANFNCKEAYNEALTTEGYKQGGLGDGVTTIASFYWKYYNNQYALTPCGYCNEFGNGTGLKTMTVVTPKTQGGNPTQTYKFSVPRWRGFDNPFGELQTNLDGILIQGDTEGNPNTVYTTTDPTKYSNYSTEGMEIAGHQIHQDGYIKEFDLGEAAHIIPKSIGGHNTNYKCGHNRPGTSNTSFRTLLVGGTAQDSDACLGEFDSRIGASSSSSVFSFRTVSTSVSFPE